MNYKNESVLDFTIRRTDEMARGLWKYFVGMLLATVFMRLFVAGCKIGFIPEFFVAIGGWIATIVILYCFWKMANWMSENT